MNADCSVDDTIISLQWLSISRSLHPGHRASWAMTAPTASSAVYQNQIPILYQTASRIVSLSLSATVRQKEPSSCCFRSISIPQEHGLCLAVKITQHLLMEFIYWYKDLSCILLCSAGRHIWVRVNPNAVLITQTPYWIFMNILHYLPKFRINI